MKIELTWPPIPGEVIKVDGGILYVCDCQIDQDAGGGPGPDQIRGAERAKTYPGIAKAMAETWG